MNQEYSNATQLKKLMNEQEKLIDKNGNPLNTLIGVGDNYQRQMER